MSKKHAVQEPDSVTDIHPSIEIEHMNTDMFKNSCNTRTIEIEIVILLFSLTFKLFDQINSFFFSFWPYFSSHFIISSFISSRPDLNLALHFEFCGE